MSSCWSPYSAPSLVRQHSGYKFIRQTTEAGFAGDLSPRAVLFFPLDRPMMRCIMRCIMAGMDQKDRCPRLSSTSLSWCGGRSPWSSDHGDYTVAVRQCFFVPCCAGCAALTGAGCGGDCRDPSVGVVFVNLMSSTSVSWRRGRLSWSCLFMHTIELPHLQFGFRPCWAGRASFVLLAQGDLVGPCAQAHRQG